MFKFRLFRCFSFLLLTVFIVSLTGCGGGNNGPNVVNVYPTTLTVRGRIVDFVEKSAAVNISANGINLATEENGNFELILPADTVFPIKLNVAENDFCHQRECYLPNNTNFHQIECLPASVDVSMIYSYSNSATGQVNTVMRWADPPTKIIFADQSFNQSDLAASFETVDQEIIANYQYLFDLHFDQAGMVRSFFADVEPENYTGIPHNYPSWVTTGQNGGYDGYVPGQIMVCFTSLIDYPALVQIETNPSNCYEIIAATIYLKTAIPDWVFMAACVRAMGLIGSPEKYYSGDDLQRSILNTSPGYWWEGLTTYDQQALYYNYSRLPGTFYPDNEPDPSVLPASLVGESGIFVSIEENPAAEDVLKILVEK